MFKKNKKRGQVGTIFIYIFALIVFAAIFFFGYKAIQGFIGRGEEVTYIKFRNELQGAVERIYRGYGDVAVYDERNPLIVPGGYREVCFLDLSKDMVEDCETRISPIVCDGWKDKAADVFLLTGPPVRPGSFELPVKITVDTDNDGKESAGDLGYLCVEVIQNRLDIILEGKGDHAFISAKIE